MGVWSGTYRMRIGNGRRSGAKRRDVRTKEKEKRKKCALFWISQNLSLRDLSSGVQVINVRSRERRPLLSPRLGEARGARTDTLESIFPVVLPSTVRAYRSRYVSSRGFPRLLANSGYLVPRVEISSRRRAITERPR